MLRHSRSLAHAPALTLTHTRTLSCQHLERCCDAAASSWLLLRCTALRRQVHHVAVLVGTVEQPTGSVHTHAHAWQRRHDHRAGHHRRHRLAAVHCVRAVNTVCVCVHRDDRCSVISGRQLAGCAAVESSVISSSLLLLCSVIELPVMLSSLLLLSTGVEASLMLSPLLCSYSAEQGVLGMADGKKSQSQNPQAAPLLGDDAKPSSGATYAGCRLGLLSSLVSCPPPRCHPPSCRVVSCRVVSCRVVSCRVVSCRVVSCRVVSYRDRSPVLPCACCAEPRPPRPQRRCRRRTHPAASQRTQRLTRSQTKSRILRLRNHRHRGGSGCSTSSCCSAPFTSPWCSQTGRSSRRGTCRRCVDVVHLHARGHPLCEGPALTTCLHSPHTLHHTRLRLHVGGEGALCALVPRSLVVYVRVLMLSCCQYDSERNARAHPRGGGLPAH